MNQARTAVGLTNVAEGLVFCAPPLALLAWLERDQQRQALPTAVAAYLHRWQTLRTPQPVPAIDEGEVPADVGSSWRSSCPRARDL